MAKIPDYVYGIIYVATCGHPDAGGKMYVGQTRSHVLNHGKYREFGEDKRWAQHVSEAKTNAPTRQSWKLNNAIRKYGRDSFMIERVGTCSLEHLDPFEALFIEFLNTGTTMGYNIQRGDNAAAKNSEESRVKTGATLRALYDDVRVEKYKNRDFVTARLALYLGRGVRVYLRDDDGETFTNFYGQRSSLEESAKRAMEFALAVIGDVEAIEIPHNLSNIIGQQQ